MKHWTQLKQEFLKDKAVANEYAALDSQYQVAARLIELRLAKGFTQAELARAIGTHQSAIARLESGASNPSLKLLDRIAHATGVHLKIQFQS